MQTRRAVAAIVAVLALAAVAVAWFLTRKGAEDGAVRAPAAPRVPASNAGARPKRTARPAGDADPEGADAPASDDTVRGTQQPDGAVETCGRDAIRVWAGRVVDLRGEPVAGARVSVGRNRGSLTLRVRSAADGAFRLPGLRAVHSRIDVAADGFAPWHWESWPGREDLVVRLARSVVVRGVVVHADGTPAADAKVNHVATTDAAGRFETTLSEGREQGLYAAWGRSPGDAGDSAESGHAWIDVDPAHPPTDVRVVLDTVWTWVGVLVTRDDGRPLDAANVWFRWPDGRWFGVGTATSGRATMTVSAPAGTPVELRIYGPRGWSDATGTATSLADAGPPVTIALHRVAETAAPDALDPPAAKPGEPAAQVTLRLGDVAALAQGPDVSVFDALADQWQHEYLPDASDTATFTVRAPSHIVAWIWTREPDRSWVATATVVPGDEIRLECPALLAPRRIRGRVTGPDGAPVAGARVDAGVSGGFLARWDADTCTDAAGRFEVLAADTGLVWVSACREGLARGFVRAGPRSDDALQVRLAPGGAVDVRPAEGDWIGEEAIVTAAADPATGARSDSDGGPTRRWKTVGRPARNGTLFDDLPPGRWRLQIEVRGRSCDVVADVRAGETTTVRAPPYASIAR